MNKKITGQIQMYMSSLINRALEEDSGDFIEITAEFKSGIKIYPAGIRLKGDSGVFIWEYSGRKDEIQGQYLLNKLIEECEKYESVIIKYTETGKNIFINADVRQVKMFTENRTSEIRNLKSAAENSHIGNREYIIKVGEADDLLKTIGIMASNGKIKNDMIRKYNQIDHFVELIQDGVKEVCANKKRVTVLDCACGKSYLSFALNFYIKNILKKNCTFIGIDYSDVVIKGSKEMAEKLKYNNMEFIKADLKDFKPDSDIDICISLHACDTATDMALACALKNKASMIIAVPCCHKELLEQYSIESIAPLLKYGILKARISDALTDGLRANFLEGMGYDVSVIEYISPLETPKNLMIRAHKKRKKNYDKMSEYWNLCNALNVTPALAKYEFD